MPEKVSKLIWLFNEIRQGEKAAFDELFNSYYGRLVSFAQQYTHEWESAEEIVSGLFIRIWLNRHSLSKVLNPEVYLYIAVKNACLNYIRSQKRRAALLSREEDHRLTETMAGSYVASIEDKELKKMLDLAVSSLPAQRAIIFRLIKEDGLKPLAVAQILGISKRTVENQLYKAVKALAEVISGYLGYHPQSGSVRRKALTELSVLFFMM